MAAGDGRRREGERQWQFWREQLSGELPMLDVPVDRPRPAMQTQNGASHVLTLPDALSDAIRSLARAERATLHATLLAAFQVLLHRYTGQDDILVGTAPPPVRVSLPAPSATSSTRS